MKKYKLYFPGIGLAVIFLLYLVVFWRRLFLFSEIPFHADTLCFYFPNWAIGKQLLKEGWHVQWDPFRNMGQPFLAVPQNQALYPLRFLSPFLDYLNYTRLNILFHILLSSGFGYLLLHHLTRDKEAGMMAAIGLGFGGLLFSRVALTADFCTAAWVPALFYFLTTSRPVLLGIGLSLQWLAGYPPLFLVSFLALIGYGLASIAPMKKIYCVLKGLFLMFGLTAIQALPFIEMLKESDRPLFLNSTEALVNSTPPPLILRGLLFPSFFSSWFDWPFFLRVSFHAGPLILILFIYGFIKGTKIERRSAFFSIFFFLMAMGNHIPFYSQIPMITVFRYPGNWILPAFVFLIIVSGLALARIKRPLTKRLIWVLIGIDFLLLTTPIRFPWGRQEFFTTIANRLPGLEEKPNGERIMHLEMILHDFTYWNWEERDVWELSKAILLPSIGPAFGVREVGSHHNLTSLRSLNFRKRLHEKDAKELLDYARVKKIILSEKKAWAVPAPRQTDFFVVNRSSPKKSVFLVNGQTGTVTITAEKSDSVAAQVEGPGQAVYSECFFPGWKASVDGQETEIELFEDTFPSINVPAGTHTVTFWYAPTSFFWGAGVSGTTVLILFVFLGLGVAKKKGAPMGI